MAYNFERFANNSEEFVFYPKSNRKLLSVLKNRMMCLISAQEIPFWLSYGHVNCNFIPIVFFVMKVLMPKCLPETISINQIFNSSTLKVVH